MQSMEIEARLKELLYEIDDEIDVDEITTESRLKEDVGLSSVAMLYMAVSIENEFEIMTGASQRICVTDAELRSQMGDLIRAEFGVASLSQLSADDRLRLCLLLKRNFNASVKQIARVLRLSQTVVAAVL